MNKTIITSFTIQIFYITKIYGFIEMIAYQNNLIPMRQGYLLEPPKAISIQSVTKDEPKYDDEYMIFDGQFYCKSFFFSNEHSAKTPSPIEVTDEGIVISVNEEHPEKA